MKPSEILRAVQRRCEESAGKIGGPLPRGYDGLCIAVSEQIGGDTANWWHPAKCALRDALSGRSDEILPQPGRYTALREAVLALAICIAETEYDHE